MKKLLLSLFLCTASACVFAQAPTWDFDTPSPAWNGTGPNEQPNGWITGNILVSPFFPGNTQSIFKATVPDVHGAPYAMQIVTVDLVTNPDPTMIPDPIGFAATGTVSGTSLKTGFSYTGRPISAGFWYKYSPAGTDTASFFMYLSKWNTITGAKDTIAIGYWETSATTSTYALTSVTLTYLSATLFPDTAGILFSATGPGCLTCGNVGSTLWVDDVFFSGWNGIHELASSNDVIVFPNPANNYLNIIADVTEAYSVIAYDATGRMISSATLSQAMNGTNRRTGVINTSDFASGLYSYSVIDSNGNVLKAGKFNVVK